MARRSKTCDDSVTLARMNFGTLLVTSLFVIMVSCTLAIPARSEWIALALMICAGIPHGSFDLRVAEAKWREGRVPRAAVLVGYLACVFGMSALCVFQPLVGLSLFLVISAAHFSEGERDSTVPPRLSRGVLFGIGAILVPIGLHVSQAQAYMGYFVPQSWFFENATAVKITAVAWVVLIGIALAKDLAASGGARNAEVLQRLICLCAWIFLPPLAGFAVWFIGRHSRQHLEVCKEMFKGSRLGIPFDFILISILAIVGLAPFAVLFDFSDINQLFAAAICLIAGLTLPHMIVSHGIRGVVSAKA